MNVWGIICLYCVSGGSGGSTAKNQYCYDHCQRKRAYRTYHGQSRSLPAQYRYLGLLHAPQDGEAGKGDDDEDRSSSKAAAGHRAALMVTG
jgi:hypothetical protein